MSSETETDKTGSGGGGGPHGAGKGTVNDTRTGRAGEHGRANGAVQGGAFGTTEQDAPTRPYDRLLPEVEALKPKDPMALERIARAIYAAQLSVAERETLFKIAKGQAKLDRNAFERLRRSFHTMPNNDAPPTAEDEQQLFKDAFAKCRHLLHAPDLLLQFVETVQAHGVVGEGAGIIAAKLTLVSRLLDDPTNLLRIGPPSSGKNAVVNGVLYLASEGDDYVFFTAGSAKAVVYMPGGLKHKLLYVPEAAALASRHGEEDASAVMIRTWISERKLIYYTVEEVRDPISGRTSKVGRKIELEGPIAAMLTTARDNVEDELLTRLLVSAANESQQQTVAVTNRAADKAAGKVQPLDQAVVNQWRAVETCLRIESKRCNRVVVPFADKIHAKSSFTKLAQRREFPFLMSLTMASALLHQWQRDRLPDGTIVAHPVDYQYAQRCLAAEMGAAEQDSSVEALNAAQAVETLLRQACMGTIRREVARRLAGILARLPGLPTESHKELEAMSTTSPTFPTLPSDRTRLSFRRVLDLTRPHREPAFSDSAMRLLACRLVRESLGKPLDKGGVPLPAVVRVSRRVLGKVMGVSPSTAQRRRDQAIEAGLIDDLTPEIGPQAKSVAKLLKPAAGLAGKANQMRSDSPYPEATDI